MHLRLDVKAKTREATVAALRNAIKQVQELVRLSETNMGEEINGYEYVLKWDHAPTIEHAVPALRPQSPK